MRIVGFSISKILAERKESIKGRLEIKSNVDVKDIQKEDIDFSDKPTLKFDFGFTVDYNPQVANIEIRGSVLAIDDKNEGKEILKQWKKKKFNHPMKLPLFNFIMNKCNLKALQIEEDLNLPPHVPLPKINTQQVQQGSNSPANYAG